MRDQFKQRTKTILAARVAYKCSNPTCRKLTIGPSSKTESIVNLGVACHISAASIGGPRYNTYLTPAERVSAKNGLWLCQTCAKLIDSDVNKYDEITLQNWKNRAENEALFNLGVTASPNNSKIDFGSITPIPFFNWQSSEDKISFFPHCKKYYNFTPDSLWPKYSTYIKTLKFIIKNTLTKGYSKVNSFKIKDYFDKTNLFFETFAPSFDITILNRNSHPIIINEVGVVITGTSCYTLPIGGEGGEGEEYSPKEIKRFSEIEIDCSVINFQAEIDDILKGKKSRDGVRVDKNDFFTRKKLNEFTYVHYRIYGLNRKIGCHLKNPILVPKSGVYRYSIKLKNFNLTHETSLSMYMETNLGRIYSDEISIDYYP